MIITHVNYCILFILYKIIFINPLDLKSLNDLPFKKIVAYIISWYTMNIASVIERWFSNVLNDKGDLDQNNLPVIFW